jgi:FAD:protein FMN transferase
VTARTAQRRARPLLGTLVEVGVSADHTRPDAAIDAAFAAIAEVEACLSAFRPDSDVARFHALPAGAAMAVRPDMAIVLAAAAALRAESAGLFDISLGSGPQGWHVDGPWLQRLDASTCLDLGGIGKGHAVDRAIATLATQGCAGGWVNAGGDLRAFGSAELEIVLRDEATGGTRRFAQLAEGAFATSHFGPGSRSRLTGPSNALAHASVAAPSCLWADSLTKVVALSGDVRHLALRRRNARAWLH